MFYGATENAGIGQVVGGLGVLMYEAKRQKMLGIDNKLTSAAAAELR